MSREQYQVPTTGSGSNSPAIGSGSSGAFSSAPAPREYNSVSNDSASGGLMYYMCGDCAVRVPLEKGAPIRCQKCGARVLYKERTKRMVQFEAR